MAEPSIPTQPDNLRSQRQTRRGQIYVLLFGCRIGQHTVSHPDAQQKLETYGTTGERLVSWRAALECGEPFVDGWTGARGLILQWEQRPWVVILRADGSSVVTTYPSDVRTVQNRRGGGRWIFPSN